MNTPIKRCFPACSSFPKYKGLSSIIKTLFVIFLTAVTTAGIKAQLYSQQNKVYSNYLGADVRSDNYSGSAAQEKPWKVLQQGTLVKDGAPVRFVLTALSPLKAAANIDQLRNGGIGEPPTPNNWVNGNAGPENSHYAEGWSIPYRVELTGLTPGAHNVIIEWDIMGSSGTKHAIDYITHYQNLDNPVGSHFGTFGHNAEIVNPLNTSSGPLSGVYGGLPSTFPIPPPSSAGSNLTVPPRPGQPALSFNALVATDATKDDFSMWGGTITGLSYVIQGNEVPNPDRFVNGQATSFKISFTVPPGGSSVLFAWGGHIASQVDWGLGNSASDINGSPYHSRVIIIDDGLPSETSIGNQDRSLKASAVVVKPECSINSPNLCPGATGTTVTGSLTNIAGVITSYAWSLVNNTAGAVPTVTTSGSIPAGSSAVPSLNVNAPAGGFVSGTSFTAVLTVTRTFSGVPFSSTCSTTVLITNSVVASATANPAFIDIRTAAHSTTLDVNVSSGNISDYNLLWSFSGGAGTLSCNTCENPVYTASPSDQGQTIQFDVTLTPKIGTSGLCPNNAMVSVPVSATAPCLVTCLTKCTPCAGSVSTFRGPLLEPGNTTTFYLWKIASGNATINGAANGESVSVTAGTGNYRLELTITYTNPALNQPPCGIDVTVIPNPTCGIDGPSLVCPSSVGNNHCGPAGMDSYSWSISGNGTISGASNGQCVIVNAGSACGVPYILTLTITKNGCSSTCPKTVAVNDTEAPVISDLPGPSSVECPAKPEFATPTASDACDAEVTLTFKDVITPGDCPQEYSVTRTWTATDDCNNSSQKSQTISVTDNTAPVISDLPGPSSVECPARPEFATPTASDACDAEVTLTFKDVITPGDCPQEYSVTRTWTATDDCNNSSQKSQTISVTDNTAPVISDLPGPSSVECPARPEFATPTASDACDAEVTLTFKDVITPGDCPQEYSVTRTWTATDDCNNSSQKSQTISVTDNTAPVISDLPGPSSVECPARPEFATPTASDACDAEVTLTFKDVITPGDCPQEYSVTRTWTATDDCNNSSQKSQTISVTDNTAPVISDLPGPSSVECPARPEFATPTASDACDAEVTLTFKDVITPGDCPQEYSVTRTWTATDDCNNSSQKSQTISVTDNTAPVISDLPGPSSVECPARPEFATPTASDACDAEVTLTFKDEITPGDCPQEYSVTRTWTATDDCNNSSQKSQTISVTDNTAPVISDLPGPSSVECPARPEFATPTASDACDAEVTLTFKDVITPGDCPQEYSVTRTWTATDDCNNSSQKSQTISVTDNTAPVISDLPGPSSVECPARPEFATPTASDACDAEVTLTFKDVITPGDCPQEYSVTRTWTATDDCNNSSQKSQTISVTDNTAPVISDLPGPSSVECPARPEFATPTASDACDAEVTLTFKDVITPGDCPQEYSVTRTWTATDDCNNSSQKSQTISVTDNTAPVISDLPGPSSVECPARPEFATPTASDACDAEVTLTFKDVITPGDCPQEYSVTRTWTATDDCNNSSQKSQTISVTDNTAPVISDLPGPSSVECPARPEFATPTASDACDAEVTLTFKDVITPGDCPQEYSVTRTWTATDDCNNSSQKSQTISVTDNTAPKIACGSAKIQDCGTQPVFDIPTALDLCDAAPVVKEINYTVVNNPDGSVVHTKTWTATDACGNTSAPCSQVITIKNCGKACTPGFWKTHSELWDAQNDFVVNNMPGQLPSTPGGTFTSSTNFFTYFGIAPSSDISEDAGLTMLEATELGGGNCMALARHGVSALLGAAAFPGEYPFPAGSSDFASLYALIKAAFQSGDCSALHTTLAAINELDGPFCGALSKLPNMVDRTVTTIAPLQQGLSVNASPNPFSNVINFTIVSLESGQATLEIYDLVGRKLSESNLGKVQANISRTVNYQVPELQQRSAIIYKVTLGNKNVVGKMLPVYGSSNYKP